MRRRTLAVAGALLLAATAAAVAITYPSGRVVTYTFDFADRALSASSAGTNFVTSANYLPFGPEGQLAFGNGTTKSMTYDARYRPLENKLTSGLGVLADYQYSEDAVGNITAIRDAVDPSYNRDFGYDDLHRLTRANSGSSLWGSGAYTYDAMGNMLSLSLGADDISGVLIVSAQQALINDIEKMVHELDEQAALTFRLTVPRSRFSPGPRHGHDQPSSGGGTAAS